MNTTPRAENATTVKTTDGTAPEVEKKGTTSKVADGTGAARVGIGFWVLGMGVAALGSYGLFTSGASRLVFIPLAIIAVTALIAFLSPVAVTKLEQLNQVMRWQVAALSVLLVGGLPVSLTSGGAGLGKEHIENVGYAVVTAAIGISFVAVGIALTQGKVTAHQEQRARAERQELAKAIEIAFTQGKVTAHQEQRARAERQELAKAIGLAVSSEMESVLDARLSAPQQTSLCRWICGRRGD